MTSLWRHHDAMNLDSYVRAVQRQLAAVAETGGPEARAFAGQLAAALESAIRLALQDALATAVSEITCELAPGSVELRLRGRDPEFVVTPPAGASDRTDPELFPALTTAETDDRGALARINLRVPARLKTRIDAAATAAGLSVNAWLVRVVALAADGTRSDTRDERISLDGRHYRGWAR
jgi:uncharacterized protein (DUF1778 family)